MNTYAASLSDIRDAAQRIVGHAHRPPVFTSTALDELAGCQLFFKCENFQKIGAFKFRGAMNAIACLSEEEAQRGGVTHSSGNHAQAVALAAKLRGISATIVMPTSAPAVKKRAVLGYGATVVDCAPTLEARETTTADVIARTGATLVHAYDNDNVIAGQGTVGLELLDQVANLDAIVTPVGGGGLLAGVALATHYLHPEIDIHAAEPTGADDAYRSIQSGERVRTHSPNTIADGLLTTLGERNWPVVRDLVKQVHLVDDDQIRAAMRLIWERMKLVVEPSAATPLAVALSADFQRLGHQRVALVLTGGNLDLDPMFVA
ncbi:MAG: pyridoxal-phosphate dependent enzyme [Rhodobacterales bacterium]|nr:pyridoxal-phosphate dependent enzyme [Rhodobacterales bacterium]